MLSIFRKLHRVKISPSFHFYQSFFFSEKQEEATEKPVEKSEESNKENQVIENAEEPKKEVAEEEEMAAADEEALRQHVTSGLLNGMTKEELETALKTMFEIKNFEFIRICYARAE